MGQNSLLTGTQREFLRAGSCQREEKYSKQQRSYHRQNIHERLRGGVIDCHTILRRLDVDQIQTALQLAPDDHVSLDNGAAAAIGLLYLAYSDRAPINRETTSLNFERRAEKGIRMAINETGESVESVTVTVEIERGEAFDDLDEGDLTQYTEATLLQAKQEGAITSEQFLRAVEAKDADVDPEDRSVG